MHVDNVDRKRSTWTSRKVSRRLVLQEVDLEVEVEVVVVVDQGVVVTSWKVCRRLVLQEVDLEVEVEVVADQGVVVTLPPAAALTSSATNVVAVNVNSSYSSFISRLTHQRHIL